MPVAYRVVRPFTSDGVIQRPGKVVSGRNWKHVKPLVRQRFLEQIPLTTEEYGKMTAGEAAATAPAPAPGPKPDTTVAVGGQPSKTAPPVRNRITQDVGTEAPDTSALDGDEGNGEGKRLTKK